MSYGREMFLDYVARWCSG